MFAPLALRDFRLLFLGLLIGQALSPFQFVAQIIWVQMSAADDVRIVLVGLIAAVRGVGMLVFGLYGGALADRFDRRKLLIITQLAALAFNVAIGCLMIFGAAEGALLLVFYVLVFLSSALASTSPRPASRSMPPEARSRFPSPWSAQDSPSTRSARAARTSSAHSGMSLKSWPC